VNGRLRCEDGQNSNGLRGALAGKQSRTVARKSSTEWLYIFCKGSWHYENWQNSTNL